MWYTYWYEKNLFGDIIAVYDQNGYKLVEYIYDAWGNIVLSSYASGLSEENFYNPFRYRGYYYDTETELYYLNSRYYDSKIGRFINADVYVSTGQGIIGNNMFAYCNNNPIMCVDYTGEFFAEAIAATIGTGIVIGGLLVCTTMMMEQMEKPRKPSPKMLTIVREVAIAFAKSFADQFIYYRDDVKEKVEESPATPSGTIIYRRGGTAPSNLTPSSRDVALFPKTRTGLSFSLTPTPGSAMTTIEAINATGILYAVIDGPDHVSVFPVGATLEEWHNAGSSSMWTITLKMLTVKYKG